MLWYVLFSSHPFLFLYLFAPFQFFRGEMSAKKAHRLWDRRLNVSFDGDTSHYLQQNTIPATFAIFSHSKGAHQHYYYNIVCSIFILKSGKNYQKNSKDSGNSINSNINILHTTNRVLNLVSSKYQSFYKGLLHKTNKNTTLKEMSHLPLNTRNSREMRSQFSHVKRKKTSSDAFSYSRLALIAAIVLAVLPNSANSFSTQHKHIIMPAVANNINSCRANSIISDRRSTICNMSMPTPSSMVRDFIWMNKEV